MLLYCKLVLTPKAHEPEKKPARKVNHKLSKREVTNKVFLMSHFSLSYFLAPQLLIGQRSPLMRPSVFSYSKGWAVLLKPSSPGLCNVQKLALKFTWPVVGSESAKHIIDKQTCSEVGEEFILGWGRKYGLNSLVTTNNSLLKKFWYEICQMGRDPHPWMYAPPNSPRIADS